MLGLTFTTKAAAELRGRIRDALAAAGHGRGAALDPDEELAEPTVVTYNAYAAGLLTEHGLRIGHEPDIRVMADASRYQLAARAIARHRGEVLLLSDSPQHVIDWMLALESAMSEHLVDEERVRRFTLSARAAFEAELDVKYTQKQRELVEAQDKRLELLGLVHTYRDLKAELGLMDFSDQIALAARLAAEQPAVGELERARYRVVMLDEYQDTSVAQARMLAHLFSGADPEHGRGHPVTAVGDPNQAIYGWRGASVSNILGFGHDFPTADGRSDVPALPLTTNRRSDVRILEVANRLADPLYRDFPQTARLRPRDGAASGDVGAVVHSTYDEELEWLAREVADCHAAMSEPQWREIGVLTRDNGHAADVFDALSRAEIPVEIVGLSGLLRLPEVSEVVSTLALLHDLTANADLLNLLTGPRWAIGPRDLALLGRRARELAGASGRSEERLDLHEALQAAVAGADPTEVVALSDALAEPGDLPYSAAARERFTLAGARAALPASPHRRDAARPGAPDHRHLRHRRRARRLGQPGGPRAPRQPRPVREGGRRVPVHRRVGDAACAACLPHRRGRARQRARHRHALGGRLGQAAHRPPREGPRVGCRVRRGRLPGPVPEHALAVALAEGARRSPDAAAW